MTLIVILVGSVNAAGGLLDGVKYHIWAMTMQGMSHK
jgi:hypothetical protein